MNWAAVGAVVSVITLLLLLIGGGVMWGKFTERVDGQSKRLDSHKAAIAVIEERLNDVDVQVGRLQEWKDGFNAAARVSGRTAEIT